jgi:two-component system, chemotaxis family, response regulator WspR
MSNHRTLPGGDAAERTATISVLLVDDQRFVGLALTRLLASDPDIRVHCCHAAADAVAVASDVAPAVIFQDLQMPDIDGLSLLDRYRENPATADTPVVVLSGSDDEASRQQALAAGASDYLVKLPGRAALVECIRQQAASKRVARTV